MKDKINYFILLPLLLLFFFLESTFLAQLFINYFPLQLVFIALTAAILLSYSFDFIYLAFFFGVMTDIFSGGSFGIQTCVFVLTAILIFLLKAKIMPEDNSVKILAIAAGSAFIFDAVYLALAIAFSANPGDFSTRRILEKTAFDMIAAVILIRPMMKLIYKRQI
jgi:rod shape-determining protein MreD